MDDIKIYGKNTNQLDSLVRTVYVYSQDIGMSFGLDKCAVLEMKRGRMVGSKGIYLPDGEKMKEVENEGYKYLGVLQLDQTLNNKMKTKIRDEYIRRVKKICKSKLNSGNLILGINSWAVGVIRYSGGVVDWTKEELVCLDRKTRKILNMYRALHCRSSIARLYLKRKEGGRGLISVHECVEMEKKGLSDYLKNSNEWMLEGVIREGIISETESKDDYKKRMREEKVNTWNNSALHGQFNRQTKEIADPQSWTWVKNGFLKKETEGMIFAAQGQSLRRYER